MALIAKLLGALVKRGSLTVIGADGERQTYGPGGAPSLTVRLGDRKVPLDLLRNPRLAIGETYMDGRLVIEDGTILDLLQLITGANRWEDGGRGRKLFGKSKLSEIKAFWRRNRPAASRRNVAHHYDLSDALYETFLD